MISESRSTPRFIVAAVLAAALSGCTTEKLQSCALSYVAAIGAKVAAVSDCAAMKWTFAVLDSPRQDAFSTEGGHVYTNRGTIELLRSESDLAAVLAHEIAHNCNRDAQRNPNAEAQLRLLNQRYPSGELVVGQWVKVIE